MSYLTTAAITLRRLDFSETSQIAMLITPSLGQVHVLAKGSRKPSRGMTRWPLEELAHYDCVLSQRARGRLHILTEWKMREGFPRLHADLRLFWASFYAAETVLACTTETSDDGPAYACMLDFLRRINADAETWRAELFRFLMRLLRLLGWAPSADRCVQCGRALADRSRFSAAAGGGLCGDCGVSDPSAFSLSRGALAVLHTLGRRQGVSDALRITPTQAGEIQRAFNEQIQYHLGRSLRSVRLMPRLLASAGANHRTGY